MNLKSKLVSSIATMSLAAALVGGATFAWFTASASNDNNQFTAGTVIMGVYDTQGSEQTTPMFNLENIAPGDDGSYDIVVKNTGSLELKYNMALNTSGGLFAGINPVTVKVFDSSDNEISLSSFRTLASGASETLKVQWAFPSAAENEYQGATGSFNLAFDGIQTKNN